MARSRKALSSGLKKIHQISRKLSKAKSFKSAQTLMKAAGRVFRKSKCSQKTIRKCVKSASRAISRRR